MRDRFVAGEPDQTFDAATLSSTQTFDSDYPALYWEVTAVNDAGSNNSGINRYGIDRTNPLDVAVGATGRRLPD